MTKQELKKLRRKAIRYQNNSSRKISIAEAMRAVQKEEADGQK